MNPKKASKKRIIITITAIACAALICASALLLYKRNADDSFNGFKVTQYSDITGAQGSFYTLENAEGNFIIIDGGWEGNEARVRDAIKMHNNHVDVWIITHPHQDHVGAFNKIYANPQGITIDRIYDSPIDYETVISSGEKWDDIKVFEEYLSLTEDAGNITHLHRGDEFDMLGLKVQVLNSYDQYVLDNSSDITNDSSLMLKISSRNKSMIFCGDIKYQMEDTILSLYRDYIKCDYIQAAHHGNWSFSEDFYDAAGAGTVFFDAPEWIMNDEQYPAYELKAHLEKNNVETVDFTTSPNVVYLD